MPFILSEQNSIANHFMRTLRDRSLQQDRAHFRQSMERLGQIMAYEISKRFAYTDKIISTPLGNAIVPLAAMQPVLITVLRAGLPFFQGFIDYFDHADCGFIGAYRREGATEIEIQLEYQALPPVNHQPVIIIDPMLATGKSFVKAIDVLLKHGIPSHIYIASLLATPEGIAYLRDHVKAPYSLFTCSVDEKLNDSFFIVPGLGDAGDLSFGEKM